jgi:hypothetical protein
MKKVLKQVVILLAMAIAVAGCNSSAETNNEDGQPTSLEGTKWKLQGIADVKTGALKVLEPKDCEECYTLTFDTDTTARGLAITNIVFFRLNPFLIQCGTSAIDYDNEHEPNYYCNILFSIESYAFDGDKLKFLFNDGKNYLLFKRIKS